MNINSETVKGTWLDAGATSWRRLSMVAGATAILALALMAGCKSRQAATPTDQQLSSSIQAKIHGESALAGQNVQVSVSNGVATLSGTVTDPASRALAGQDSGSIPGGVSLNGGIAESSTLQSALLSGTLGGDNPYSIDDPADLLSANFSVAFVNSSVTPPNGGPNVAAGVIGNFDFGGTDVSAVGTAAAVRDALPPP